MVTSARTVRNRMLLSAGVSAMAMAAAPAAAATCPAAGPCNITVTSNNDTVAISGLSGGTVVNTATGTTITAAVAVPTVDATIGSGIVIDNRAGASIAGLTLTPTSAQAHPLYQPYLLRNNGVTIINAGAITGDVTLASGGIYVNAGGTINGALRPSSLSQFSSEVYIERDSADPIAFDPGKGIDIYSASISSSGNVTLRESLPTNFEVFGLEVRGANTVATLVPGSDGRGSSGMVLRGEGSVVNTGTINRPDLSGSDINQLLLSVFPARAVSYAGMVGDTTSANIDYPINTPAISTRFTETVPINGGLESFANQGTINGDLMVVAKSFSNSGSINLASTGPGTIIAGVADTDFSFTNSGSIALTDTGAHLNPLLQHAINLTSGLATTTAADMTVTNDTAGVIDGGISVAGFAKDFTFDNKGMISIPADNPNFIDRAVDLDIGQSEFGYAVTGIEEIAADSVTFTNSGTIDGGVEGRFTTVAMSFSNSGTINNDVNDDEAEALHIETNEYGPNDDIDGATFTFTNTGDIEGTAHLVLETASASITNSGDITRDALPYVPIIFPANFSGLDVSQETTLDADLTLVNTGTISTHDYAGGALSVTLEAGDVSSGVAGADTANATASITNAGSIISAGGVYVTPGPFIGQPDNVRLFHFGYALGAGLDAEGTSSLTIHNQSTGVIRSDLVPITVGTPPSGVVLSSQARGLGIAATADLISITNDGEITGAIGADFRGQINPNLYAIGDNWLDANALEGVLGGAIDTLFSQDTLVNSATGTITGGIALRQGDDEFTNAGLVTGNVYMGSGRDRLITTGTIDGHVDMGSGNDIFIVALSKARGGVTGGADGGDGVDSLIFNATGGGALEDMAALTRTNFEFTGLGGTGTVTANDLTIAAPIQLVSGSLTLGAGSTVSAQTAGGTVFNGVADISQDLTNRGTINGSVALGDQSDSLSNYGTINGNIDLGSGDDFFTQGINATLTGTADGGEGYDTFNLDITGGGVIRSAFYNQLVNFEVLSLVGSGSISSDAPLQVDTIELNEGAPVTFDQNSVIETQTEVAVTGSEGGDELNNQGTINGDVDLGDGDNQFNNTGTVNGDFGSGTGSDQVTNNGTINGDVVLDGAPPADGDGGNGGQETLTFARFAALLAPLAAPTGGDDVLDNPGTITGSVDAGAGNDTFTNSGSVGIDVAMGDGDDTLTSSGSVGGNVDTGTGDDTFTNTATGTVGGDVTMGAGADTLINAGSITGNVYLDNAFQNPELFAAAALAAPTGDEDVLETSGSIGGNVEAGGGNDRVTVSGSIAGYVDMGDGDDTLELHDGWSIDGDVFGGTGDDAIVFDVTSTYAEPTVVDMNGAHDFESVSLQGGVVAYTGTGSFETVHVEDGRLIGRAGSVLDASVTVDQGATFGSAGTVNGNIVVNGTLSPGASPGTMTINGDVALGATSNTVFEFTPGASDAIVIDGELNIAAGASLTLTGNRPLTPGSYVLIDTTDGINGTFGTNITRDNTVLGILRQTDNTLELVSTFQLGAGANVQVQLTNAYLNDLLVGDGLTAGILDAFDDLVGNDGFANQAVLSTLNPEAYASAVQMGFENGMAIATALRGTRIVGPQDSSGIFVFGQAYGANKRFSADANGVSRANVRASGFLGGVGFGTPNFGVAAFVGKGDSRQNIPDILARNDADGMFFGGRAHFAAGGFEGGASVIFDRAKADTTRNPLLNVAATHAHYDLHATTIDAWAGYGFAVGGGMKLGPQVGITHSQVKRETVTETGGGAFALEVAGQKYKITYLTADLKLSGPEDGTVRGWVAGGVRRRIDGDPITATARFTGTNSGFTVFGAQRDRTLGHVGAGVELTVAKNVDLYANGDFEIDENNGGHQFNGGLRIRF